MRAALLSPAGIFLRIEEVEQLTERHLPQIVECDLPTGQYQWIPDPDNPYGGAFWHVKWVQRVKQDLLDVEKAKNAAQTLAARRAARRTERGE
jgi:hypothetical protein